MEGSELNQENIASKLKGNTLRVYWHLLRASHATVGPREIQRRLGFSSPALAVYHLEKLIELGLVQKVGGEYQLVRVVNVGILKQFVRFGTFILPRYTLYATMFTTLLIFYLTQLKDVNFYSVFALIFGVLGTGILWYETLKAWLQRP
ncbi:MAG: hypothetical protein ACE5OW_06185 [Candidatus Bathyarchaeia archaeon]